FAIQLLIFVYLYQSHRVRFFQYLLLAWGAYTLSKALKLFDVLVLQMDQSSFVTELAPIVAVGFTLAAAFAHRWDYRLSPRDALAGFGVVVILAFAGCLGPHDFGERAVGAGLGAAQIAAGLLFWPQRGPPPRFRGARLLAGLLTLWGIHRIATQFLSTEAGSTGYMTVHGVYITIYFLSTFAVIIMVLERARSESDRLHARLREAERLATAGEMAAGMAHEIRNPLAAIWRSPRPQEAQRAPADIGEVVEHVGALVRDDRSRAARVDVRVAVDPAVPRFRFDRDQITQVVWNVALNGVEARDGG